METFIIITYFLILGLIMTIPILLFVVFRKSNVKCPYIYYFLTGLLFLSVIICFFAWWGDKSSFILLEYYGYNIEGMSEIERYEKILPENIERVKKIENSIMGIGWPLKAIFGFLIFAPYLLIVYIGNKMIGLTICTKKM